jgi:hypothetical protein
MAWGKKLMEIWKQIEFFDDRKRLGSRIEPTKEIKWEEDALQSFLIGLHAEAGTRNIEATKAFLTIKTSDKGRLDR